MQASKQALGWLPHLSLGLQQGGRGGQAGGLWLAKFAMQDLGSLADAQHALLGAMQRALRALLRSPLGGAGGAEESGSLLSPQHCRLPARAASEAAESRRSVC